VELQTREGDIRTLLAVGLRPATVGLAWLGQAGFAVRSAQRLILIDPYLSDSLAEKHRGKELPHIRLMPPPIAPAELDGVDVVLCTHRHSDHMDPGTLPVIARNNPTCRFVLPRAERESAEQIGVPVERTLAMDAGETISPIAGVRVSAIPSAHETLETNDRGEHRFLGYVLRIGEIAVYHSGDCVPYDGLAERLRRERIDLALLPANGRDEFRRSRGVPGNMTFEEAVTLCAEADIHWLIPHHFEMFAFNTADRAELARRSQGRPMGVAAVLPQLDTWFELR
jgi:L-ascorbate metabolism protein UlaG (beta-lactamase superfamily)